MMKPGHMPFEQHAERRGGFDGPLPVPVIDFVCCVEQGAAAAVGVKKRQLPVRGEVADRDPERADRRGDEVVSEQLFCGAE